MLVENPAISFAMLFLKEIFIEMWNRSQNKNRNFPGTEVNFVASLFKGIVLKSQIYGAVVT